MLFRSPCSPPPHCFTPHQECFFLSPAKMTIITLPRRRAGRCLQQNRRPGSDLCLAAGGGGGGGGGGNTLAALGGHGNRLALKYRGCIHAEKSFPLLSSESAKTNTHTRVPARTFYNRLVGASQSLLCRVIYNCDSVTSLPWSSCRPGVDWRPKRDPSSCLRSSSISLPEDTLHLLNMC